MACSRLMEDPDPDVHARAAAEWVAWEDAVISMEHNSTLGLYGNRRDAARLAFVRTCARYFAHGAFLDDGVLICDAGKLAGIPGVLVQRRSDLGGPVITAWELARAWPGAELVVIEDSGHTGMRPPTTVVGQGEGEASAPVAVKCRFGRAGVCRSGLEDGERRLFGVIRFFSAMLWGCSVWVCRRPMWT